MKRRIIVKRKTKFLILLIFLVLIISSSFVYSRYASKIEKKSNYQVANWSFKINGKKEDVDDAALVFDNKEERLNFGKISPGSFGEIPIHLDFTGSEVDAQFLIEFDPMQDTIPQNMYFTILGKDYRTKQDLIDNPITGTVNKEDENKIVDRTIYWYWPYESEEDENSLNYTQYDEKDTQDMEKFKTNPSYLDIVVTAIQK